MPWKLVRECLCNPISTTFHNTIKHSYTYESKEWRRNMTGSRNRRKNCDTDLVKKVAHFGIRRAVSRAVGTVAAIAIHISLRHGSSLVAIPYAVGVNIGLHDNFSRVLKWCVRTAALQARNRTPSWWRGLTNLIASRCLFVKLRKKWSPGMRFLHFKRRRRTVSILATNIDTASLRCTRRRERPRSAFLINIDTVISSSTFVRVSRREPEARTSCFWGFAACMRLHIADLGIFVMEDAWRYVLPFRTRSIAAWMRF